MAVDPEIERAYKDAMQKGDAVATAQEKIDPVFKDLSAKIPAAIKEGDGPMLAYFLKALRVELNAISTSLQDIIVAFYNLEDVEDDEDFLAEHLPDVEKLTKSLSSARTELTRQYEAAKALENDAEKGLKSQPKGTKEEAFQELAKYDKWITEDLKELAASLGKIDTPYEKAENAVSARDAKALAEAQKATQDLDISGAAMIFESRETDLKALLKKFEAQGFDPKVCAALKDGVNDLLARHAKGKLDLKLLVESEKEILAFKIVEIDLKKAVKVLGLDAKAEAKLAKVLKGPPAAFEKGLGALARELKLKTTGKAMLAALQKAGVV